MVDKFEAVVKKYQDLLEISMTLPATSYGRSLVGRNGVPTRLFFAYLFMGSSNGIAFLKETGLIRSEILCWKCGENMNFSVRERDTDGYAWRCCKRRNSVRCGGSRSVRYGSWFTRSKLTMVEVLLLTYDIIRNVPSSMIETEYSVQSEARRNWYKLCREVIVWHVEMTSEKIGGEGKVVDESKFGRRKYHRGHHVRGQWVFGEVERGSGKTFLVPVADRTADSLVTIIKNRIEPGTRIISDCWAAYWTLSDEGYEHQTVNHSISFVDEETGAHTNTIEFTWRQVEATLPPYNRQAD